MKILNHSEYEGDDHKLSSNHYQNAIFVQSACNASGVAGSLKEVYSKLWDEATSRGKGTDWVNQHPIAVLYCHQLNHLCGRENMESDIYFWAHEYCTQRSK